MLGCGKDTELLMLFVLAWIGMSLSSINKEYKEKNDVERYRACHCGHSGHSNNCDCS